MTDTFIKSFTHLAGRPKADQALPLLKRIASLVKPIMRKHGWVLPVLAEFFPESPNLVGEYTECILLEIVLTLASGLSKANSCQERLLKADCDCICTCRHQWRSEDPLASQACCCS